MRICVGVFLLGTGLAGCLSNTFKGPEKISGKWVSKETLNLGHDTYVNYCMQCHGLAGDGKGPASAGTYPPPRNFKDGLFKFNSVASGELPTDEDLKRTIRYGLKGTPMLPWDISDERLNAVVQYIKTFSPAWREGQPGAPVPKSTDPYGVARASEGIALGKQIYHGLAQCYTCHPSFSSPEEIGQFSKQLTGTATTNIREHANVSVLQDSSYGYKVMPPDFTKTPIRTGGEIDRLYEVIGAGVGGTTMASWKGILSNLDDEKAKDKESDERQWALAYYVNSLHKLKFDSDARKVFFDDLNERRKPSTTSSKD